MSEKSYIEDVFLKFYDRCLGIWSVSQQDGRVLNDFYIKILSGEELTQNQGNYLLRLMSKYKNLSREQGLDIDGVLKDPHWKIPFRVLDQSKSISVEENDQGLLEICLKFPYSFKDTFEKEIENHSTKKSQWDPERKLRKLDLYNYNLIHLFEFVKTHGFSIDNSFMEAVSQAEEIWDRQEDILPYSTIEKNSVVIRNASQDTHDFFESQKSGHLQQDIFLAKRLGFIFKGRISGEDVCEKISSSAAKEFWIKDLIKFVSMHQMLNGCTAIILDRNTENTLSWLEKFLSVADYLGVSRSDIKVCFRESENKSSKLNNWIKENNVGGTVKGGKILIFQHKPAKWVFKDDIDIKLIGLNSFTPVAEPITSAWIGSHHCVCYLTEIRPTKIRGNDIVEL